MLRYDVESVAKQCMWKGFVCWQVGVTYGFPNFIERALVINYSYGKDTISECQIVVFAKSHLQI